MKLGSTLKNLYVVSAVLWGAAALPLQGSQCAGWRWLNPSPQGNQLNDILVVDSTAYAVGEHGTVLRREEGGVFELLPPIKGYPDLTGVAWDGNVIVATTNGAVYASTDGQTWSKVVDSLGDFFRTVAWGNGLFLAASDHGLLLQSLDGITWIENPGAPAHVVAVYWTGDRFVARTREGGLELTLGTATTFTSVDGSVWQGGAPMPETILRSPVTTPFGTFAVGTHRYVPDEPTHYSDRGIVVRSPDGRNWTTVRESADDYYSDLVWTGTVLVAVGAEGTAYVSADGVTWTRHQTGLSSSLRAVAWSDDSLVAVGENGALGSSPDGASWSALSSGFTFDVAALAQGGDLTIVVGGDAANHGHVAVSAGMTGWVTPAIPDVRALNDVAFGDGNFVAVGDRGAVLTSSDGATWLSSPSDTSGDLAAVTWGRGRFVAVQRNPAAILVSEDGTSWTPTPIPQAYELNDVTWGDRFVAVGRTYGSGGTRDVIVTSLDGLSWTTMVLGGNREPVSVTWNGRKYLAVGDRGILASRTGENWPQIRGSMLPVPSDVGPNWIAWTGTRFLAEDWYLLSSPDGYVWSKEPNPVGQRLRGATASDGAEIVFGEGGAIAVRDCTPEPMASATGRMAIVPAAAHVQGLGDTQWWSELWLYNPADTPDTVGLYFLPRGQDNSDVLPRRLTVPAQGIAYLRDVVRETFDAFPAAGALAIVSEQALSVSSRTFTSTQSGSFGQYLPALSVDLSEPVAPRFLAGLRRSARFRTNLGLVNGSGANRHVVASFRAGDGSLLRVRNFVLAPFDSLLVTDVMAGLATTDLDSAYAVVESDGGGVLAFASIVDNLTADPGTSLPLGVAGAGGRLMLPGAANLTGKNGTRWRTDLTLLNPGTAAALFSVSVLPRDADVPAPSPLSLMLAGGNSATYDDILGAVFSFSGAATLQVDVVQGELSASARTYNDTPAGTYGQTIPGIKDGEALAPGSPGLIVPTIESGDSTSGFRTNVGFQNAGDQPVTFKLEAYPNGSGLREVSLTLQPRQAMQIDGFYAALFYHSLPVWWGYVRVHVLTEGGRVHAYASVVDNRSGDPFWLPAK